MEKIDLRELNKMTKTFRACHRALKKFKEEEDDFEVSFCGSYRSNGMSIPIIDEPALRRFIVGSLETELAKLKRRFADMGIDPMDIDGRKKKKANLKVAER